MGDRLGHVHLADGKGSAKDEHLVPGRGTQPCAELLERLALTGFDGHVVIEVNTRRAMSGAEREADLAEALAFTRLHLASAVPGPALVSGAATPGAPAARRRPAAAAARPARRTPAPAPATASWPRPATEFAERGYDKTSVRGIAKAAGVDAALVHHYFGTKEQVFEAAIEVAFAPALSVPDAIADGPLDGVGERLARFFFGVWENPATRTPLLAIIRSALTNETAAAVLPPPRRRASCCAASPASWTCRTPKLRAELAAAQLIGIAMLRYVIKMEPLASADPEQIIAMVAPRRPAAI